MDFVNELFGSEINELKNHAKVRKGLDCSFALGKKK